MKLEIAQIQESAMAHGHFKLERIDSNGVTSVLVDAANLIVQAGKNFSAAALVATATPFGWIAVGTNGTAASLSDTALGTELARAAVTSATAAGPITTFSASFPPGVGTGTWQEAGIFNAASAGTMYSHLIFAATSKLAGDTFTITWSITQL
jgi:hypothetical protein